MPVGITAALAAPDQLAMALSRAPWLRHALISLITVAFAASLMTDAASASTQEETAEARPLSGIFDSCTPDQSEVCAQRLAIARQMGFRLVINGGLGSGPKAARQYAQSAEQLGLQVAWPLSNEGWWIDYRPAASNLLDDYPTWAQACACGSNAELLHYIVTTLARFPNTWGWYAADDLQLRKPETVGAVTEWTQRLKTLAPQQATVISVWNTLGSYRNAADYVAQESYPFGLPQGSGLASPWREIADLAQETQRMTPGRASFILQGFS